MPLRRNILRIFFVAVALGLLIFFAFRISAPSIFDSVPGLARGLQAVYSAGGTLSGFLFKDRHAFNAAEAERIRILAGQAEWILLQLENASLRQALGLGDELTRDIVPAGVAGFFREGRDEFMLIGRGRGDGLRPGLLVIDGGKILVGTVQEAGEATARVKLLSSPSSVIEVTILFSGGADFSGAQSIRALAKGDNIGELIIDLVPQDALVVPGEPVFYNFESGRKFLVGEVREVDKGGNEAFLPVRARHLFDPFSVETVFVLVP